MQQDTRLRLEYERLIREESQLILKGFHSTFGFRPTLKAKIKSRMDKLKVISPEHCVMTPKFEEDEPDYYAPQGKNKAVLAWLEHMKPCEVRINRPVAVEIWEELTKKYQDD